jgi:hypothetical protein
MRSRQSGRDSFSEVDGFIAGLPRRRALLAGEQEGVSLRPADDALPVELGSVGEDRQPPRELGAALVSA